MRARLLLLAVATLVFASSCQKTTPTPTPPSTGQQTSSVESRTALQASTGNSVVSGQSPAIQESPAAVVSQGKAGKDACALLSSQDLETVQGEAIKETKLTARSDGGFAISQCFFTLPTFTNSVSLAVTQKADTAQARDPKEFWKETFHRDAAEMKREREREEKDGEKEEVAPPQRITGIGDDAYWMGSRIGGALYVLKGGSYLRVSIGGPGDQTSKLKRSKALAQMAIARLS